jgi:predicted ribosome quality control (RQC) complex YloA/Tae2 family protein
MSFDGLAIAALASELRPRLVGTRIQKVIQPDGLTYALECYGEHRRSWLLLSADPQRPRAYLTSAKPGRGTDTPSPLLLLLRKHVEGLRVAGITQPPGERILRVELVGGRREDEQTLDGSVSEPSVRFELIIEAIGQYSNLILVDASGVVVECARRVSAEQNRVRTTLPRHPYVAPPSQAKQSLHEVDVDCCRAALIRASTGTFVWQALVSAFAGLGPLAGREIAFRALGDTKTRVPTDGVTLDAAARDLARETIALVEPVWSGTFQASIARARPPDQTDAVATPPKTGTGVNSNIVAFAPYPLTHLPTWERCASLSEAAEAFFEQGHRVTPVEIARAAVRAAIASERSLADRKRESLLKALERSADLDELRRRGEALLTYSSAIPRGAATFAADGLSLDLDPRLSAVENAQACFRRYRKAKSALQEVPALLEEVELRLRYLDEVAAMLELAETADAVRELRAEIKPRRGQKQPTARRRRVRRPEDAVLRLRTTDNAEVLVGRSAQQNEAVTFGLGRPEDLWLHARGCPGAHVIVRSDSATVSPAAIREAAAVAAFYSANRPSGKVTVDWTRRKHVRRINKSVPGLVSYTGEQSLVVRPAARPGADDE